MFTCQGTLLEPRQWRAVPISAFVPRMRSPTPHSHPRLPFLSSGLERQRGREKRALSGGRVLFAVITGRPCSHRSFFPPLFSVHSFSIHTHLPFWHYAVWYSAMFDNSFYLFKKVRMMSLNEWLVWHIDGQKYCLFLTTDKIDATFCFGYDDALRTMQSAGYAHQKLIPMTHCPFLHRLCLISESM